MTESLREMMSRAWAAFNDQMATFLPKLFIGLFILLVGFLIARLIRGIIARFFLAIRLDRLSDRFGVSSYLARGDVRYTVAEILATTIYWLVLILTLQILGLVLGMEGLSNFFGQILGYLPPLVVALAILLIGIGIGTFFGAAAQVAAANAGFPPAKALGAGVRYLIAFFALVIALEELKIATQLLVVTVQIIIGAVALGLALAFGLGCKDLAGEAVRGWLKRDQSRRPHDTDS